MAIVEALSAFVFEIQVMASLAYLGDIARRVGEETMNTNTALFLMVEVGSQFGFMVVVVAVSMAFGLGDIATARVGQALCVAMSGLGFWWAWKKFPAVRAKHARTPEQGNLLTMGFKQNWNTFRKINRDYKHSLRWFLLATIFAESAANAYITVAVIFLTQHLGLNTTEVGIFFIVSLVSIVLACRGGEWVTKHTDPNTSWRLSML